MFLNGKSILLTFVLLCLFFGMSSLSLLNEKMLFHPSTPTASASPSLHPSPPFNSLHQNEWLVLLLTYSLIHLLRTSKFNLVSIIMILCRYPRPLIVLYMKRNGSMVSCHVKKQFVYSIMMEISQSGKQFVTRRVKLY